MAQPEASRNGEALTILISECSHEIQLAMSPPEERLTAQERAWVFICNGDTFTTRDVVREGGMSYNSAQGWVKRLADAGLVRQTGRREGRGQAKRYTLCSHANVGRAAVPPEVSKRRKDWKQEAWTAMRIKRRFTVAAILVTLATEVQRDTVYRYCRTLEQNGYLSASGRVCEYGGPMSHKIYELARDVGPKRPFKPRLFPR